MEKGSCPFVSRELLSRIPEDKRQELEAHYSRMAAGGGEEGMMSMMQQQDTECPVSRNVDQVALRSEGKGACPFISTGKPWI